MADDEAAAMTAAAASSVRGMLWRRADFDFMGFLCVDVGKATSADGALN
jgi:hypothetical protein